MGFGAVLVPVLLCDRFHTIKVVNRVDSVVNMVYARGIRKRKDQNPERPKQ